MQQSIYSCDDGGSYYVTQFLAVGENGTAVWFGGIEGGWGNVFWGRFRRDSQLYQNLDGEWWDVPFGPYQGKGKLSLEASSYNFSLSEATGGFGGKSWSTPRRNSRDGHKFLSLPRKKSESTSWLNGVWQSAQTGALYYIRQDRKDIIWFAAREDRSAAHVFKGRRDGNSIRGDWVDVPYGDTTGNGKLNLEVWRIGSNDEAISVRDSSQSFGTSMLFRMS